MSTTTLTFRLTASSTPVDPDGSAVALRDPTGAYGVQRADNAAVVVATATAMVRQSAGIYTYSFTDPAANLVYRWVAEFTYNGLLRHLSFTANGGGADAPTSLYTTFASFTSGKWGEINIAQWSDKDNLIAPVNGIPQPDLNAIQYGFTLADGQINTTLQDGPFIVPLVFNDVYSRTIVQNWANDLAGYFIYFARGMRDSGGEKDGVGNALKYARKEALNEMAMYKGGVLRLNCARRWPSPTSPAAVG